MSIKSKRIINNVKRRKTRRMLGGNGQATLKENLNKLGSVAVQSAQNAFDWSINELSEYAGVDPNKSAEQVLNEASRRLGNLNAVLKSPEGERLMAQLKDISSDIGENVLAPAMTKITETAIKRSGELGQQAVKTGLDVVGMVPGIGEVVEGVRTASDLVRTGEKLIETGAEITGIATDATNELMKKKEEASGVINDITNMINSGLEKGINVAENINNKISDNIASQTNKLSEQRAKIEPYSNAIPIPQSGINENNNISYYGGSNFNDNNKNFLKTLKLIQKGGRMSAKRALKSQQDFLKPTYLQKKILKQFNKTKKSNK